MSLEKRIAIIGAGVIGTTTAARLIEQFGDSVSITLFSDQFSPNTTGDVAAGLWGPYCLGDTPSNHIKYIYVSVHISKRVISIFISIFSKWSKHTHDYFQKLWQNGDAIEAGVSLLPVIQLTTESGGINAPWRHIVFGCTDLDAKAIEQYGQMHKRNYK